MERRVARGIAGGQPFDREGTGRDRVQRAVAGVSVEVNFVHNVGHGMQPNACPVKEPKIRGDITQRGNWICQRPPDSQAGRRMSSPDSEAPKEAPPKDAILLIDD